MSTFIPRPPRLPIWSAEVLDIYQHLTPEEYQHLCDNARETGRLIGSSQQFLFYILFPAVLTLTFYVSPLRAFLILLAIFVPLGLVLGWRKIVPRREAATRLLCETAYAQQKGYTPQALRLYRPLLSLLEPDSR